MIIGMFNGKSSICSSFIRCYFQYVLLFKKLCLEYENEYSNYVNKILNSVKNNKYNPDKNIIPDIGNLFMLLFFSNRDIYNEKMKKIWYVLFEEFAIRQAYWIFHENQNKAEIMRIMAENFVNEFIFNRIICGENYDLENKDKFYEDIEKKEILEETVDIIMSDPYFTSDTNYLNEQQVKDGIKQSFKKMFSLCNKKTKQSLQKLIVKNINIADYIPIDLVNELKDEFYEEVDFSLYRNEKYDAFKVDEILPELDKKILEKVLNYAFESQKGNKLLTF